MADENKQKVTILKLAQDLGLSATTVSRALSGKGRVSEATRQRIQEYVETRGLIPATRQNISYTSKTTKVILVTVPAEGDYALLPYFSQILFAVCDYFSLHDYQVMVAKTYADDIRSLKQIIERHKVDGVLLTRTISEGPDIRYLQEKQVPFVAIGSYDDRNVYQVDVNQVAGCRELTSILLHMGIRDIALFCANRGHVVTRSRLKGFLQAYEENGIVFDQRLLFENAGDPLIAERLTENMIKREISCIVCMDDNICLHVLNTLRKNSVRIPQDIKVASFYNSEILNQHYPSISCVDFNIKELGTKASITLHELLRGNHPRKHMILGYDVVLKEST